METPTQLPPFQFSHYRIDFHQGGQPLFSVNTPHIQGVGDWVRNAMRWYNDLRVITFRVAHDGRARRIVVPGIPDGETIR